MISFDVESLFTNVPLDLTIDIILRKIYVEKVIKTNISREKLKTLLILCTKGVPFVYDDDMYEQKEGVAIGSPLGSVFADIFMSELENTLVPNLSTIMNLWHRYVDDTFAMILKDKEKEILDIINAYHPNIKFTFEKERNSSIPFLDVLVSRDTNNKITTSVYRKATNTDVYINWHSHSPKTWKISTLKTMVKRAFLISSTKSLLQTELNYIADVFCNHNQYPKNLVQSVIKNEKIFHEEQGKHEVIDNAVPTDNEKEVVTLMLPYGGKKGEDIIRKMKKDLTYTLSESTRNEKETKIRIIYRAKRLSSKFIVKDKTKIKHMHNVVYHGKCRTKKCTSHYVGQTKCRVGKRIIEHNRIDRGSHLLKHAETMKHRRVWMEDFKVLGTSYSNSFKRKISESLFVKELKPDLNVQKTSYKLLLYN